MSLSNVCMLEAKHEGRISPTPRMAASLCRRFYSKSYGSKQKLLEIVSFYGNLRSFALKKYSGIRSGLVYLASSEC